MILVLIATILLSFNKVWSQGKYAELAYLGDRGKVHLSASKS